MKKIIQNHSKSFKIIQNHSKSFKNLLFLLVFTTMLVTQSCTEQEINSLPAPTSEVATTQPLEIKLVRKINNPYSLTNMQKAFRSLKQINMLKSEELEEDSLVATHYYVRFLPKDSAEYEALKADTTLTLFPYPLDYELTAGTTFYDSTLTAGQITWQYTKVPIDYSFTNVEYQKLDDLYMPIDLPSYVEPTELKSAGKSYYDLLDEAMVLTGNATKDSSDLKRWFPKKWQPTACIRVWDDIMGEPIPLVGVQVRARHLLHWDTERADINGNAVFEQFRYAVNYSLAYQTDEFDIRDGLLVQGIFNGPDQKAHWGLDILSGQSIQMATMFRAAYRFFHGNNLGINRQMQVQKICYINKQGTGDYWGDMFEGLSLPDVRVYGYSNLDGSFKKTQRIFSVTTHELGHASHRSASGIEFYTTSKFIRESWADCVEWAITMQEYKDRGLSPDENSTPSNKKLFDLNKTLIKQEWPVVKDIAYSPLFIDLIDNYNQKIKDNTDTPYDNVTGYNLATIQKIISSTNLALQSMDVLSGQKGYSVKFCIKEQKPNGVTDKQIDDLFQKYEEVIK